MIAFIDYIKLYSIFEKHSIEYCSSNSIYLYTNAYAVVGVSVSKVIVSRFISKSSYTFTTPSPIANKRGSLTVKY